MRLQKFLAHAGLFSRRKAEAVISEGRVKINGSVITHPGVKVDPEGDVVLCDGQTVKLEQDKKKIYIALNKPEGYICSCSSKHGKIVLDLIDLKDRIYPVGRLDKDSAGLLLLTNDGEIHNRLSHPSYDHEKEYRVTTLNPLRKTALDHMADGMIIDGVKTRKAIVSKESNHRFRIVLKQGLNRQIRRMVGKTGNTVTRLKRIRIANIRLGRLKEGQWRYLTLQEIHRLLQ